MKVNGLGAAKWVFVIAMLAALGMVVCAPGCTAEWPYRWKHTEPERQAATLVVDDIIALEDLIPPEGALVAAEAKRSARIVQKSVGLPDIPLIPGKIVENAPALTDAEADANRPPPTPAEVVVESTTEFGKIVNITSTLVDELLLLAGAIGGVWGFKNLKGKLDTVKAEKDAVVIRIDETTGALKSTVLALDEAFKSLPPEITDKIKGILSDQHDKKDERIIDLLRRE